MDTEVKTITRKFGKTAIIVITAIFIISTSCIQSNQNDIVGEWKGKRGLNSISLIINDNMEGVFTVVDYNGNTVQSHTVSVEYSKGRYNIMGKRWIKSPFTPFPSFANLKRGVIKNDVLSAGHYTLRKTTPLKPSQPSAITGSKEKYFYIATEAVIFIILGILVIGFLLLPKNGKRIVIEVIKVVLDFIAEYVIPFIISALLVLLAVVTFGIISGGNRWKNDRGSWKNNW